MAKKDMISNRNLSFKEGNGVISLDVRIDLSRFDRQFRKAQYVLDTSVMASMEKFMPMETGTFIAETKALSQAIAGSGKVYAAAPPFGRYLYYGKVMVDELTGSPYARRGARKVLVSQYAGKTAAKEDVVFSKARHPKAEARWFEKALEADGEKWIEEVKKIAGGG